MTDPKPLTRPTRIVLASGSPRRKELLAGLGVDFEIVLPTVDEKDCDVAGLSPRETVLALSRYKGESVAAAHPEALVIAADTIVEIGGDILEKPVDEDDAARMLIRLQGAAHTVHSAIAVFYQGEESVDALATMVRMRPLTSKEIAEYIRSGEPMDKAGSYAIQGLGATLIQGIGGCYFNVVGMSLILLDRLCADLGLDLTGLRG